MQFFQQIWSYDTAASFKTPCHEMSLLILLLLFTCCNLENCTKLAGWDTVCAAVFLCIQNYRHAASPAMEAINTTCRHTAKDVTPPIAWRREALKEEALDNLSWKGERGPSDEQTVSKVTLWKLLRQGGAHMGFTKCIDTILSWTELEAATCLLPEADHWVALLFSL